MNLLCRKQLTFKLKLTCSLNTEKHFKNNFLKHFKLYIKFNHTNIKSKFVVCKKSDRKDGWNLLNLEKHQIRKYPIFKILIEKESKRETEIWEIIKLYQKFQSQF